MQEFKMVFENHKISGRIGRKGETIVFLHADFVDSRMWDGILESLSKKYQVVVWDKIGYGNSDLPTGPLCRRKELSAVIDSLNISSCHLVGCSNGGQQALDYTLENPNRVASLTLVNSTPSGFQPQGQPPAEILLMIGALQSGKLEEANELQTKIWFDGPSRTTDSLDQNRQKIRILVKAMNKISIHNNTFYIADMNPKDPINPPALTRLSEIKIPVLIVDGELDYSENRRASALMGSEIPGAKLVTMSGCAHVPPTEEPEDFAEILLKYLGKISTH